MYMHLAVKTLQRLLSGWTYRNRIVKQVLEWAARQFRVIFIQPWNSRIAASVEEILATK
jgi:hypothetical protein